MLELLEFGIEKRKWSKVITLDSMMDYICFDFIRSSIDYMAILEKEKVNGKLYHLQQEIKYFL